LWPGFALRLGRSSELTRITLRRASPQDGSPTHTPTSLERTLAPATAG
jgi:uncharacterized protein